jgi:hypothetical protein
MSEVTDELVRNLSEALTKKDKQVDALVAEQDRLRNVVRELQEQHDRDNRRIVELLEKLGETK